MLGLPRLFWGRLPCATRLSLSLIRGGRHLGGRRRGEGPDLAPVLAGAPDPASPGAVWGQVGAWGHRAQCRPYQERLEEPEGADQPDVQVGVHLGGRAVEGVGHHQEGVGPHREELPVVGTGGGDGLVGLEQARPWVPLVDDAVDVVVVSWKPSGCVEGGAQTPVASWQPWQSSGPRGPCPRTPAACPAQPGLGHSGRGLLTPHSPAPSRPSEDTLQVAHSCLCPDESPQGAPLWMAQDPPHGLQGLGGGAPCLFPASPVTAQGPLAPTSPAGQAACSLGPPWPASHFHGELGERAPGVALPISGWWGLLRPPQSSLMGLGLRETLNMEPTEA